MIKSMKKSCSISRTLIMAIGLIMSLPTDIHAQSIITRPNVPQQERPTSVTPHSERPADPVVMPAADMYNTGIEYHQDGDYETALRWFRKAALQKDAKAQNTIGEYYEKGLGVEQDLEQAETWYKKAADQGYEPAVRNLERLQHH